MNAVSIIGATFYGNRGAEAMLSATVSALQERCPNTLQFNIFSYYPDVDRRLIADSRIRIYSAEPAYLISVLLPASLLYRVSEWLHLGFLRRFFPTSVRALAGSKVLVCLAGISFMDGRNKFLPFNVATLWPALVLGVPVVKLAQAMGPFENWLNRLVARSVLSRCYGIFARGDGTLCNLQKLKVLSPRIHRAADAAFLFCTQDCMSRPYPGLETRLQRLAEDQQAGQLVVGLCPSSVIEKRWRGSGEDYLAWLKALITALVAKGYVVALYPNATRGEDMKELHNNDLPAIRSLFIKLDSAIRESVVVFDGSWNVAQLSSIVAACDFHIVSRFHAMVAALNASVPVLVIGWSHKYAEVMDAFGQRDMVVDDHTCDLKMTLEKIDCLSSERYERASSIAGALPKVKESARHQFDYLVTWFDNFV
jgi:polysaccharide pyruvyl transferase WcaK-like protein